MQDEYANATLGDIVAQNYQAAPIFDRYGLDYCCGGRISLAAACREHGLDLEAITADLRALSATASEIVPEDPAELAALIVERHHSYVRHAIPSIQQHLAKVSAAHGRNHPELLRVCELFEELSDEFLVHLAKEEQVLFPYIQSLAAATNTAAPPPLDVFGTVQNPIRMMELEHQSAGDDMAAIRSLTAGFVPPGDACATYRLVYAELQAFERDLHVHVHLENNVLFPRAIHLEAELERGGKLRCDSVR